MTQSRLAHLITGLCIVVSASQVADATVTQVDGTIIPEGNNLQNAFPAGETLDAVLDAAELPEVFLPNTQQPVVFSNLAEGAGFENSFGWYNVGDDISTPLGRAENLHPIFGCGSPMQNHPFPGVIEDHHHGDPAFYVQNSEPFDQIAVDFGAEQAAGRYRGGFIGFYLITPEGGGPNCGDFVARTDVTFGYIYYTQKDLNNDGDFVHHLVYNSTVSTDRFFFGFEDLFRGGDNDFEDMLIQVDGLTPPCVPAAEICDGIDNDCDGLIDVADPDIVGEGSPCICDNVNMTCSDGVVFGECQAGQTVCVAGALECQSVVAPSAEVCDNLDNNCNNAIDDNPTDVGAACDGPDADQCIEGVDQCVNGVIVCSDNTGPEIEVCNGFDDDCDGFTDENPSDEGGPCGSNVGECVPGVLVCVAGGLMCQGETPPSPEVCDGLDNNCNGVIDENPTDVGLPCGATDVGECSLGLTVCAMGGVLCVGESGPTPELCDGLDNDCDGSTDESPIDVGQPCNQPGWCTPGTVVCTATGPECQGGLPGAPEVCNGLDDDCNNVIDDNPTDVGGECGAGEGVCEAGLYQCINGGLECVGGLDGTTETCNGIDDDCDGTTDEGDLCEGGECQSGQCSSPCSTGEFPCPPGQICNENNFCIDNPCFDVTCPADENGDLNVCQDGDCVPICDTIECVGETLCRPSDGSCVPDSCHYLPTCADDQICFDDQCIPDPCLEVSCPAEQFCREGACVPSCAGVECGIGQVCHDGQCQDTGCADGCPGEQVCGPNGACIDDPCRFTNCPEGDACDPQTGDCVADPCTGITCPDGQICDLGDCRERTVPIEDRVFVSPGGGGCSAGAGQSGWAWAWLMLAALACGWALGRTRRGRARLCAAAAAAVFLASASSCDMNGYCINCQLSEDAAVVDANGDAADGGDDDCAMGISRPEECDGIDNDCDALIDEDFDLTGDVLNCGACGVDCLLAGASTSCDQGACEFIECFPGNWDVNDDTTGSFDMSDGCEYRCFTSNGGVEACDNLDNDCDQSIDEGIDLTSDDNNCGACGLVCNLFQATSQCSGGICGITGCNPGFEDLDQNPVNGCEYSCTLSNGGTEACDLLDNDCDGQVDEGFDLMGDVNHCGGCGLVCDVLNATPSCVGGMCMFDPSMDCAANYHDANGNPIDGCEYFCIPSGAEVCDLIDNDCNGLVDDNPMGVGLSCNAAPSGMPTGICTDTGTVICSVGALVCAGAPGPEAEVCDNMDNDCDGFTDENVERSCYDGPMGSEGIGVCTAGVEACVGGMWSGVCMGQVLPAMAESCDNVDEDCDGAIDEAVGGGPITQSCYSGAPGTDGVGVCMAGTQTCTFGTMGPCVGQVVNQPVDQCGDGLDTDCDGNDDAAEGCLNLEMNEIRLDAGGTGDPLGTAAGAEHSFDLALAAGGSPLGSHVYAVWSDLGNGNADIYFRRSTDGGATWDNIVNLTGSFGQPAVKPLIALAPGATDAVVVAFQSVNNGVRDVRIVRSSDSGATFTAPSSRLDADEDGFHHDVAMSADGSTVALTWEALNTTTFARSIHSRVSTDGGANFQANRVINVGSGGSPIAGRPRVGITNTGRFVWVWREIRTGATNDIYAAFSDSPTAAIAPGDELRLDNDAGDSRDSGFPQLVVVESNVYVSWQDISTQINDSDIKFVRSNDGGASYNAEIIVDDPMMEVSESFTPTMAVDPMGPGNADDRIFLAWEDRRQGTQIFAAVSLDAGATFGAAVRASSTAGDAISGVTRDPRIVYAGSDAVVIAYTNDDGTGKESVFTTSSTDGGANWQFTHDPADTGTDKSLQPMIVPATGNGIANGALIGWIDFRAGTHVNGDPYIRRVGR